MLPDVERGSQVEPVAVIPSWVLVVPTQVVVMTARAHKARGGVSFGIVVDRSVVPLPRFGGVIEVSN